MDIPDLIIKALAAGAASEDTAVRQAYATLKSEIQRYLEEKGDAAGEMSLTQHESDPETWKRPLLKSLSNNEADKNTRILKATEILGSQIGIIGDNASVEGGIHIGDNITVIKGTENRDEKRRIYCNALKSRLLHLPLRGVDEGVSDPNARKKSPELDRVYVALDTKTQTPMDKAEKRKRKEQDPLFGLSDRGETRPLSAFEAAVQHRNIVLLGDPGSGKSTFVNHLALCLVSQVSEAPSCLPDRLSCWPENEQDILPIRVVLRDFAKQIPDNESEAEERHLWEFIQKRLIARQLGGAEDVLEDALEKGKAIVLLDGLDEIPTQEKRIFVRDAVSVFARRYAGSRFIVTCRVLSYQNPKWQLENFPSFKLAPFNKEKIDGFIRAWYSDLEWLKAVESREKAHALSLGLQKAVRRPDLWRLAGNPLLLTVMAVVHTHKEELPDARALLYEDITDILLWRWEAVKAGEASLNTLLKRAGRSEVDLKKLLWRIAFEAHGKSDGGSGESLADIEEITLLKSLSKLHPDKSYDWAKEMIRMIKLRAGLLLERESAIFSFPHRTFQEYFAGAHLSSQASFAKKASELAGDNVSLWREPILLAVGRLVYLSGDSDKPLALVGELCPRKHAGSDETAWQKVWLAGDVLTEIGVNRAADCELGKDLLDRVRKRLVTLLEEGHLQPVERVAAGITLSRLGDPRFDPEMFYLPNDEELGFVRVPAGKFVMGSDKDRDKYADDDEMLHTVKLSEYHIAKYPVTVAQFMAFVESSKYLPERDWKKDNEYDNHPVVNVSWEDAVAYCKWLTAKLNESGYRCQIRLPTEAQWEKAARGTDGRIYPWGDEADPDRANYDDTGIGTTSTVGCFPKGDSPYDAEDMAGNVWEWCRDRCELDSNYDIVTDTYKDGVVDPVSLKGSIRVYRGGGYLGTARNCRSASRDWDVPGIRGGYLGFRLLRLAP